MLKGSIIEPPHECELKYLNDIWYGYLPIGASLPPTIRGDGAPLNKDKLIIF